MSGDTQRMEEPGQTEAPHAGRGSIVRRVLRQSSVYALGNMVLKASGLLLAPLYLNEAFLAQVSFGHFIMLEATAQLLIPLVGLGLTTAMLTFTTRAHLAEDRDAIPMTTLITVVVAAALLLLLSIPSAHVLGPLLLGAGHPVLPVRLLGAYVALKAVVAVPLTLMRARERVGFYVLATMAEAAVLVGGVYYGLAVARAGITGIMWAYVGSAGISALVLITGMLMRVRWRFHIGLAGRLLRFGLPLVLSALALPVLHVGDRYLLGWLASAEELAIYGWGARLSGVLNMLLVQSFQSAFSVIGLKALGSGPRDASLHTSVFRHFVIWAGWGALGLSLAAKDLTALLSTSTAYLKAAPLVFPLSFGFVLYGLVPIATNIFYSRGQTRLVAGSVAAAAALNVGLNALLIPVLGGMGAAVATLLSYGALGIGLLRHSQQHLQARFPMGILAAVVALTLGLWAVSQIAVAWDVWPRLGLYALLAAAYPVAVVSLGLYRWSAVRAIVQGLRGVSPSDKPHRLM